MSNLPLTIALTAPTGRMGQAIADAAAEDGAVRIAEDGDVLVDFSVPEALRASLARAVASGTPLLIGTTGLVRVAGNIGFASLRGGTVAGDHDVVFAGPHERLILSHRAESRAIFARGAIAAARFLHGKPAGLYSMADVVAAL